MNTKNADGVINLFFNVPEEVKSKIPKFAQMETLLKGKIEVVILFGERAEIVRRKVISIGAVFEDLGYGFGIVTINTEDLNKLNEIKEIQYMELPKTLYTSYFPSNKASCITEAQQVYGLGGQGVLIGFIDSGIDYMHPAFQDMEGNTRIDYIYDASLGGKSWDRATINKAIKAPDPYSIVPERDTFRHGTHVAGIACGGGKIEPINYGVAPKASIAMIKMTGGGKIAYTTSTQIMRGIKILIEKGKELNKPLVINLSFSTNDGAHNGSSLLEKYINTIGSLERISFVIAAGNEGDRAHHIGGVLRAQQDITVSIAEDETGLILQLYKNLLDQISIEIKNPAGASTGKLKVEKEYQQGTIGGDRYFLYNTGPKPFDINGEILFSLVAGKDYLVGGPWVVTIYLETGSGNPYDIWMPISEGLNVQTKFLQPDPYNTLGIPATVENIISVGSYNYLTNTVSPFSGRGKLGATVMKPDLVAPGENIQSSVPDGGYDTLSGTSMAAPQVAGACALLMEWGIVLGKDPYLYGERLKHFLLRSAKRDRTNIKYPDPEWGYGKLCLREAIEVQIGNRQNPNQGIQKVNNSPCGDLYTNENYNNFLVEYQGDIVKSLQKVQNACAFILDPKFAVVSIQKDKVDEVLKNTKEIVYVTDPSALYTLGALSPIDTAKISNFHQNPYLPLRGQGVVVGLIDTGIDYLNTEFMLENDTTKILKIWDQTGKGGKVPQDFNFGTESLREDINRAIAAKKAGQDPYAIVNSKDTVGHGTAMAGIIGARGKNPELIGAAPDSEFIVVKLKEARKSSLEEKGIEDTTVPVYENTDIILGIKYLYNQAVALKKPMVIYIPVGTNRGGHEGKAIMERYINDISETRGIAVVTGVGNEGDADIHTAGYIERTGGQKVIELKVDEQQKDLGFSIWCTKPDKVSLGVVSPSGEVIEKIPAKLKETEEVDFIFEGSTLSVRYLLPEEVSGDELIQVKIKNIRPGIWQFRLIGDYIVTGKYDAWLPQRALLKENTRFLNPTQYMTLTTPSTSENVITAAYYNQDNNTIIAASGRGYTRDGRVKPDIAAGGVNALTTAVGGGTTTVTGSSVGAAVLAGAVALLLEWGIVDGNDPTMFSTKIKTYLIRGAAKRPGDVYPNSQWGYGMLDLNGVFENMRSTEEQKEQNRSTCLNCNERISGSRLENPCSCRSGRNGIFMRIPEEVEAILKIQNNYRV